MWPFYLAREGLRFAYWPHPATAVLIAIVIAVGIAAMPAELYPGDPFTMREESRAILLRGEYAFTDSVVQHFQATSAIGQYVVDNPRNGRTYSKYGSMAAWLYMFPMAIELLATGGLPPMVSEGRLVYLNVFNIVLSVLVAASLHRTARRMGATPWVATAYVLVCFYTTFVWYYLRAQSSEVMQLLLFSWTVTAFWDALEARPRIATSAEVIRLWIACTALLLLKVAFVFVGPFFAMGLVVERRRTDNIGWLEAIRRESTVHVIPGVCCGAIWAWNNFAKFGAPWRTGYDVWMPKSHGFNGSLADSLPQLLCSVQWGLGFCFPVLLIAIPWIGARFRRDPVRYGTLAGFAATYSLLMGMLPIWRGEWCYGPRYWVFVLPFAALPALDAIRWMARSKGPARLATAAVIVGLAYSGWLQWEMNRWPFFTYYYLRAPLEPSSGMAAGLAFGQTSYGKLQSDMYRCRDDLSQLEWWRKTKQEVSPEFATQYEQLVREVFNGKNLYWRH